MVMPALEKSHLLALPKELRLEIWKWVVTDPSTPDLVINITKEQISRGRISAFPRIITRLARPRNCPVGLEILRTNRFIYREALPTLYRSARFAPLDLGGVFPLFLNSLSPEARSYIRYIKLVVPKDVYHIAMYEIPMMGEPASQLFHWAITCAQVAQLDGQLRDVEIDYCLVHNWSTRLRQAILFPLCKIKTKKILGENSMPEVEQYLIEAGKELEAKAKLRKEHAEAETIKRAKWNHELIEEFDHDPQEEHKMEETPPAERFFPSFPIYEWPQTPEHLIESDLTHVIGMSQFERELELHSDVREIARSLLQFDTDTLMEEWDVVSYKSGASTPRGRPPSYSSRRSSNSSWTDAGSTIIDVTEILDEDARK